MKKITVIAYIELTLNYNNDEKNHFIRIFDDGRDGRLRPARDEFRGGRA